MAIKYIGRTTDFKGKSLWEILGNLRNFGVGRMVIRNRFQRYPETCYMRILKVAALPRPAEESIDDTRKVIALVERTFRGKIYPVPIHIDGSSYKTDYVLIPKDEEHKYMRSKALTDNRILPRTMEFPPLLKNLIIQQKKGEISPDNLKLPISYNKSEFNNYRIAEEGEKPTIEYTMGLGKPASPNLYANIRKEST